MSLQDLHTASGVSMMGLSYMERGIRKSRKDTIGKVEEALGLPPGTYQRLLFANDASAELEKIVAMSRAPVPPVREHTTNGVVVGRRSATGALLGFAGANIETLTTLVERIPPAAAPDFETTVAQVIDRCIETEALTVDSWRLAVGAESPGDADRLMGYLHTIESTRRDLVARLAGRNLAAKLDVACNASPLPDAVIAQMLGASAEDVWVWRNQGVIPGDAIDAVQAFVSYVDPPTGPGQS